MASEVTVSLPSGDVDLGGDDVDLAQDVREGWGVASDGGLTVALDLDLDDDLRREGVARELVRVIQDARKDAGLEVSRSHPAGHRGRTHGDARRSRRTGTRWSARRSPWI